MTVKESWVSVREALDEKGIVDASLEAEILVRWVVNSDRTGFFSSLDRNLSRAQEVLINNLIDRRIAGEPLAYILCSREFYGLVFYVSPSVLIPRQETELLVDKALDYIGSCDVENPTVADVGTGSGAIAVAITSRVPEAVIYAIDYSRKALLVAHVNRCRYSVVNTVHLIQSDLLAGLQASVNIIVANLPYISTAEMRKIPDDVAQEPWQALHGGIDGLEVTRCLIQQAPSHLMPGGQLLLEIAPQQLHSVLRAMHETFPGGYVSFARDLLGFPRVVAAQLPESW